jgi:hypothetical protein
VCIAERIGPPTPFELTDDPCWAEGGSLFDLYDLHLEWYIENETCLLFYNLVRPLHGRAGRGAERKKKVILD